MTMMMLVSGDFYPQKLDASSPAPKEQDSARLGLLPDSLAEWGAFILRATWRFFAKFAGESRGPKQQGRSDRKIR